MHEDEHVVVTNDGGGGVSAGLIAGILIVILIVAVGWWFGFGPGTAPQPSPLGRGVVAIGRGATAAFLRGVVSRIGGQAGGSLLTKPGCRLCSGGGFETWIGWVGSSGILPPTEVALAGLTGPHPGEKPPWLVFFSSPLSPLSFLSGSGALLPGSLFLTSWLFGV